MFPFFPLQSVNGAWLRELFDIGVIIVKRAYSEKTLYSASIFERVFYDDTTPLK